MKTTAVLINLITDFIPYERHSKAHSTNHTCDCTVSTHLAVKKPVKPFKLIDNEPWKICSKCANTTTAERKRQVSQIHRLKSFAAAQQDPEKKSLLTQKLFYSIFMKA